MDNGERVQVGIIPKSSDILYDQRESGITHSPFKLEYILYNAIKLGNISEVKNAIDNYLKGGITMGSLSHDSIKQMQYWSIACISTAVHYAILGGLDETDAFNFSDSVIRHIDSITDIDNFIPYLKSKALELTSLVETSKFKEITSPLIRRCIHYINIHLHERLKVSDIAKDLDLSKGYLSILFKNETGISIHSYILQEKLENSKLLLAQNIDYDTISYSLSFCSETHYITCFRRQYGITPGQYKKLLYPIIQ